MLGQTRRMRSLVNVGHALGAAARVAMIDVLFDGAPHTAGELAWAAGVAPSTASSHLAVLVDAELVRVERRGRRRFFELHDRDVAGALEQLGATRSEREVSSLSQSREQRRVREARTCYDHLAGRLGVAIARHAVRQGWTGETMDDLLPPGLDACRQSFAFDPATVRARTLVRPCLDWTERQPHLAGAFGAAVATTFLSKEWVVRRPRGRALMITDAGADALRCVGVKYAG